MVTGNRQRVSTPSPFSSMKKTGVILALVLIVAAGAYYLSAQNAGKEITVLSWDYYIGPDTIADFEKETGASVTYELIKSNEEALARVKANPGVYDILVISDYMVGQMKDENSLAQLNATAIPNMKNVDPLFKGSYFDPTMEYSVPYAYGTTGFAVNRKYMSGTVITWKELAKPEYKGKVGAIDDMRYVMGSVLMELGYDPNTTNQKEIDEAVALLKQVMGNIAKLTEASPVDLMVNENIWVAYSWSGDALQMVADNDSIEYVIPSYGTVWFLDNMVIPADAPHPEVAHEWANFILRPDVSAAITEEIQYGNPNTEAKAALSDEIRENRAIFPAQDSLSKLKYITDVGDNLSLYEQAWEDIKQ